MTIVCLDTNLIQWGVLQKATTPESQPNVAQAKAFIDWLNNQKADVILPSIVAGELLVTVPHQSHNEVLATLHQKWMIADYDIRAALQFARMRYDQNIKDIMKDIRSGDPYATRKQLSADLMIAATAIAHGASIIYTSDIPLIRLAQPYIEAQNFLDMELQRPLPETPVWDKSDVELDEENNDFEGDDLFDPS